MTVLPTPIEVFYSYADADESLCIELDKHLSLLKHEGLITTWYKRQITAGSNWKTLASSHLNTASIILLLISADFLASDYCYSTEMQHALEQQEAGTACVIPILLCPVDWQNAPFEKLKVLPSNRIPITVWPSRDAALADVVQGIRGAIEEVQSWSVNVPSITSSLVTQPHARYDTVIITRLKALLSYGKLRGRGIRLKNIFLFGSRVDIDV